MVAIIFFTDRLEEFTELFLIRPKNPCPMDKVTEKRLCHKKDSFTKANAELSPQPGQGGTNESISQVITKHMALLISFCLDTELNNPAKMEL